MLSEAIVQDGKDPNNTFFLFKLDVKTGQAAVFTPCGRGGVGEMKKKEGERKVDSDIKPE